jgi:hypothetical protein
MSRHYPKGIPKSSVRPVVPRTSTCMVCRAYVQWFLPYVRTKNSNVRLPDLVYVRLLRVSVWLLFSKGSKCD